MEDRRRVTEGRRVRMGGEGTRCEVAGKEREGVLVTQGRISQDKRKEVRIGRKGERSLGGT